MNAEEYGGLTGGGGPPDRAAQLAEGLTRVNARIDAAVSASGRADRPALIVVTKYFPASDVECLKALGVYDVGENRDQEASVKAVEVGDASLRWHFIGQLQTNKAKSVVKYAHAVHSVDRPALVSALDKAMRLEKERNGQSEESRPLLDCFIQVNLADKSAAHRGGASPADVPMLAAMIAEAGQLRLAGVMAVAPLGEEPARAFNHLAGISAELVSDHPGADAISAGMSGDLEAAIAAGATHLRVGSDVLGARPPVG